MADAVAQILFPFIQFLWVFVKTWWWVFLPFLLLPHAKYYWQWWRMYTFDVTVRRIVLEVKFPPDVQKPIKAMESVFAVWWQIHDPPNFREKWIDGEYQLGFSIEMVSTEGAPHFYIRLPEESRRIVEAGLYSQFPDAELIEVEDYTRSVPRNVPNKDWKMWGATLKPGKPDIYPFRTYRKFFEETATEIKEETRVDPIAALIEGMAKLGEGEHLWIQFLLSPRAPDETPFVEEGKKEVEKLVHRIPSSGKPATIPVTEDLRAVSATLFTGQPVEPRLIGGVEEEQGLLAPELRLTTGEREVVGAIEEKISKQIFVTTLRFIYLARTEKYLGVTKVLPFTYFQQFNTANLNFMRAIQTTKVYTVRSFFLDERRRYIRRRRLFRVYLSRDNFSWPRQGGTFRLNIEEMASFFHFPGRIAFPSATVPRVEIRKGEAPSQLPWAEE